MNNYNLESISELENWWEEQEEHEFLDNGYASNISEEDYFDVPEYYFE